MSSNPYQAQGAQDTPLLTPRADRDESESKRILEKCYLRIKHASGKWPWEWFSPDYRPRPQDWTADEAKAMVEVVRHTCNCYTEILMNELCLYFLRTGKYDEKTKTWSSTDVPLHCQAAKGFINYIRDQRFTATPPSGDALLKFLLESKDLGDSTLARDVWDTIMHKLHTSNNSGPPTDDSCQYIDSGNETETKPRKRTPDQNMLFIPGQEIPEGGIFPIDSDHNHMTISGAPLSQPLPYPDPRSQSNEDRIQQALDDLESHELSKEKILARIASNDLGRVHDDVKKAQEERDAAFKTKDESAVKLSSAQQLASKQGGLDSLAVVEEEHNTAINNAQHAAIRAKIKEQNVQIFKQIGHDLRADLEKEEKEIELCRSKIENEKRAAEVEILRQNLIRLCAVNLLELSLEEITELKNLVGKVLGEKSMG
ncbi:hypothetical protein ACHAP7_010740 [Fusarium lateritium]